MVMATRQEDKLELKMTSMIDVVFLLLIFFIVTMPPFTEEVMIESRLPRAKGTGKSEAVEEQQQRREFEDIELLIQTDPSSESGIRRTVNGRAVFTDAQLLQRLKSFTAPDLGPEEGGRVVVRCEDEVPYEELVRAISIVQRVELSIAFANMQ